MLTRLLHLDDDPDILEIGRISLEIGGAFDLVQCTNGPDAVRLAETFRPDVLLLDYMLPGMSGTQVYDAIRRIDGLEYAPVIFMTARVQSTEVDMLLATGAAGVISKPFDPVNLGSRIIEILASVDLPEKRLRA